MKKIFLYLFLCLFLFEINYCLEINSIAFDKVILKKEKIEKEFIIRNTTTNNLQYDLEIEENNKNIKIFPKSFIVKTGSEKKFKIIISGEGKLGENFYHLLLKEKILNKSSPNNLSINKLFRIKQKYILGEL